MAGQTGHAGQAVAPGHAAAGVAAVDCAGSFGCVGSGPHAANAAASRIAAIQGEERRAMWVIFLEMGVALGLLLLIVWWTWPKKRPQDEDKG